MFTLCWAAKGGSGTTVVATGLALALTATPRAGAARPPGCLLVDLGGDAPFALGIPEPSGPGVVDWLATDAESARLAHLEVGVTASVHLLPRGGTPVRAVPGTPAPAARWQSLGRYLQSQSASRHVIVDAGTGAPPAALAAAAEHCWLVTRACYLAVRAALVTGVTPTGVVLVDEPGRRLGPADLEAALRAPVIAAIATDPAVARAVDAGLAVSRTPASLRRGLRPLARWSGAGAHSAAPPVPARDDEPEGVR